MALILDKPAAMLQLLGFEPLSLHLQSKSFVMDQRYWEGNLGKKMNSILKNKIVSVAWHNMDSILPDTLT